MGIISYLPYQMRGKPLSFSQMAISDGSAKAKKAMGFSEEERQSTGNRSTEKQPMPAIRVCPSGLRTFCRPTHFASHQIRMRRKFSRRKTDRRQGWRKPNRAQSWRSDILLRQVPPTRNQPERIVPRLVAVGGRGIGPQTIATVPNDIRAEVFAYRAGENAEIVTVPDSTESRTIFDGFNDLVHAKMLAADKSGDETNYLYGKALENARRIALILAVSRAGNPLKAKIGAEDAEYAVKLVDYLISTIIDCVAENLSENADEKAKKRILKVIGAGGMKGIMRSELTRKTQFIRRNMREEYLADLIDSGEVVARGISDRFNHGETLYLAGFAPQK